MATDRSEPDTGAGPWNPGILSQVPAQLRHLCTIFRPENVFTGVAGATDLELLTGFSAGELVAFRPQRLVLHELLIRVTADFSVPDGSRIEDLGINFRAITALLLARYLDPEMAAINCAFDQVRRQLAVAIHTALSAVVAGSPPPVEPAARSPAARLFARITRRRSEVRVPGNDHSWGPRQIADCERMARIAEDAVHSVGCRSLARVMSALFTTHGRAWGTRDLIVSLATDIASNAHGSDVIGRMIEPILRHAAQKEGYSLLPRQERPVVINTKGPSASGKSSLRPLQKRLAGSIGVRWSDFALISPDIWRKQLLDYGTLGTHYKYAGALTSEELQIIDEKLDRYMASKYQRGDMSHLLIDRFRFDSFAVDSDEAGSNLLTRFGDAVYLFFVITPPELLVERAWSRGLEVGRYKAVDDTLAHSVEAYTGMPDVFFTWVRRTDKRLQYEFLDNSVRLGELPRTVAFGTHYTFNVLDVKGMLDIERYGRVNIAATTPESLYADRKLLAPEYNMGFLKRCIDEFREVNFAVQATGRIYLRIQSGTPVLMDREALEMAVSDPCTCASMRAVASSALAGALPAADPPQYLCAPEATPPVRTLGQWGTATPS
jgi:hypothetical protein